MLMRANSKKYIEKEFPELLNCKIITSRMYEKEDKPGNRDNWWFNFMYDDLKDNEHIVFAGALDYENREFKLFKVPTSYIESNINKLYMDNNGWIIIYLHLKEFIDVRNKANLSFKDYVVN